MKDRMSYNKTREHRNIERQEQSKTDTGIKKE